MRKPGASVSDAVQDGVGSENVVPVHGFYHFSIKISSSSYGRIAVKAEACRIPLYDHAVGFVYFPHFLFRQVPQRIIGLVGAAYKKSDPG
jgi:hypothetical protein